MWEYTAQSLKFTTSLVGGLRATDLVPAPFDILWYQGSFKTSRFLPQLWTLDSELVHARKLCMSVGRSGLFTFSFILTYNGHLGHS